MGADDVSAISQYTAGLVPSKGVKALGEVVKTVGENLMWFFVPPLFAGLYCRLRYKAECEEMFLMTAFTLVNLAMIVCRYCYLEVHMSNRWSFPLVAFTIFYICDGLQVVANWLAGAHKLDRYRRSPRLSLILLLIGVMICLPKLLRPAGADKRGYRTAAKWLKDNTDREDVIAVPDKRITLYAERKGLIYDKNIPQNAKYAVTIVKGKDERLEGGKSLHRELALWVNEKKRAKKILVYKIL